MLLKIELAMIIICNIKMTSSDIARRLMKGSAAKITDFPHSAFLVVSCYSDRGEGYFSCGASILNQVILLTAGHCFIQCIKIVDAIATYGHEQLDKGIVTKVSRFKIHEDYHQGMLANDIALVLLAKELKFSKRVSRVGLLKRNPSYVGEPIVAGWGKPNAQSSDVSSCLMYTRQQILPRLTCQFTVNNPKGTFCAESTPQMGYPSSADSGSALVVSEFIQVGLVSYMNSKVSNSTTVYTNISYFYDWIQTSSKKLSCKRGNFHNLVSKTTHHQHHISLKMSTAGYRPPPKTATMSGDTPTVSSGLQRPLPGQNITPYKNIVQILNGPKQNLGPNVILLQCILSTCIIKISQSANNTITSQISSSQNMI